MRTFLESLVISAVLLVPAAPAHAQVSFGLRIGPPPSPPAYTVPRQPGPDYEWIDGYWYWSNGRYAWHKPYWSRPPYPGAYWVAPYYADGQYVAGRWEGPRGDVNHDHRWDNTRQRDDGRYRPGNGHGRDDHR